jgi:NSS family neurotransmitter:Na+ symporter
VSGSPRPGRKSLHGHWSSRFAFVLAVTGSAVGLGNIWRFPYIAGENGGGAFVLVYLVCVFAVGLPLMMSEVLIGRRGRRNPVATMRALGEEECGMTQWKWVGGMGVVCGVLILSFYSIVAGWAIAYIFKAGLGTFKGADATAIDAAFETFTADPLVVGAWHTVFMILCVFVVARGVERGLEQAVRILMPALVALLLVLLGYSMTEGAFQEGKDFLFEPRFSELTSTGILEALGHAFFTLSVGMGAVMAYGAYLPEDTPIGPMSMAVVVADTAIALLAALVIFPIVFANGMDPAEGPGLVFQTLPVAFGRMPGGVIIATIFFLLLTFAAWTSGISLMEPAVAWLIESVEVSRMQAAVSIGVVIWALGFPSVLSLGPWSGIRLFGQDIFDNVGFLTNNIMLPLGGLAIVVFAGWFMAQNSTADELDPRAGVVYKLWRLAVRFVAPLAIIVVLLAALGVFAE